MDKLSSSTQSTTDESSEDRGRWSSKMDYMLSLIGYCVGLGNLWRFPYICMRNGGGAFLIPYIFCLVFCGLPLYFVETAAGQFSGRGSMHIWEVCPLFKGLGIAMTIPMSICNIYYNTIIIWTLYYLGNSFMSPLPWTTCENSWSSEQCISDRAEYQLKIKQQNGTFNNNLTTTYSSEWQNESNVDRVSGSWLTSQEDFWQNGVLQMSSGIHEMGHLNWHLVICLFGAWLIVGLCIIKGVKSVGKVVYVTATLPYILLTVILIRGFMLDGSIDGVIYYLKPDFSKLLSFQVWIEAAVQVFYSLGPGWGPLIAMASFNKFNNNCLRSNTTILSEFTGTLYISPLTSPNDVVNGIYGTDSCDAIYRDSVILTFACEGTSIYAGLVIFTVLGFMANKFSIPIEKIVKSGPGLGFVAYPEALAQLPGENVWSVLFFLMLLAVGLDSQFAGCECVVLAFTDSWPILRKRRTLFTLLFCAVHILLGLLFCSQGGIYVFQLADWYVVAFALPLFGLLECIIFGWIYGTDRFSRDVNLMIGRGVPLFIRICICFITPVMLLILFVCGIILYKPPTYGNYEYPDVAIFFGFVIALVPLVPIIVYAIIVLWNAPGSTLKEKFLFSLKPTSKWKPIVKCYQLEYNNESDQLEGTYLEKMKLNDVEMS